MKPRRVEPRMSFSPPENCKASPLLATNPHTANVMDQDKL
jgi:hypothetical protein